MNRPLQCLGSMCVLLMSLTTMANGQNGTVLSNQKISEAAGNFTPGNAGGTLDDTDFFGSSVARLGDLDNDGVADIAVGAHNDEDGGADNGSVYVLFLNADGTVKARQKISETAGSFTPGNAGGTLDDVDLFGFSLAGLGDVDGDGVSDLAVGAYLDDDGGLNNGAVYVLFLNANGTVKASQKISDTAGNFTVGNAGGTLDNSDLFGVSVAGLGDLDGDGVEDLAIGSLNDGDGGPSNGAVYVIFLNANGTVKASQKISDTAGGFTAGNAGGTLDDFDEFGIASAGLGDLDGDGIEDLAVAAYLDDDGGLNNGAVYVLFLNTNGTVKASQKISETAGDFTSGNAGGTLDTDDEFGRGVALLGDLDLDGVADLAVGAIFDDDGGNANGAAYVLFLNSNGTVKASQKISDTAGDLTAGNAGGTLDDDDQFGSSVAGPGDLDGDGAVDLVVGAIGDDDGGSNNGAVHVLFLNSDKVTAVLLSRFEAEPLANAIQLRWQFSDAAQIRSSWLERADATTGPWTRVGADVRTANGVTTLVDHDVEPDHRYYYALVAEPIGGPSVRFGPIEAQAGEQVMEFALTRLAPNPGSGPLGISYAVAHEARVKLSVLDVQGRRIAVLVDGVQSAGRHHATWSGDPDRGHAPAGVYFIRYDAAGRSFLQRVVRIGR